MLKEEGKPFFRILFSVLLVLSIFIFFRLQTPFIFQTNDDVLLNGIVSGQVTGLPEGRMIYIGYPVGFLLAKLYMINTFIPWYGVFLCCCIGVTLTVILWKLLSVSKVIWVNVALVFLFILGTYSFMFKHIVNLQYTFITTCFGTASLILLIFWEAKDTLRENMKSMVWIYIIFFIACSTRKEALYMLLPFFGLFFLEKIIFSRAYNKNKQRNIWICGMVFIALLVVTFGINKIAYSSSDWKEYTRFNAARTEVYDYSGYPNYQNNRELYDSLNISKESYEMLPGHYGLIFEKNLDTNAMEQIAKVSKEQNIQTAQSLRDRVEEMIVSFLKQHLGHADRPLSILVFAFYILFFICALLGNKKIAMLEFSLSGVARMIVWVYLLYIGRYPERVTQGIYFAELCVLITIALKHKLWDGLKRKKATRIGWYSTVLIYCILCVYFGIPKAIATKNESYGRYVFSLSYKELIDYFGEHSEYFYYLDMNSFANFTVDALSRERTLTDNYIVTGGWLPNSPLYNKKFEEEKITNPTQALLLDSHVYIVFMEAEGTDFTYLEKFLGKEYEGYTLKIVDKVTTSLGVTFQVLKAYN